MVLFSGFKDEAARIQVVSTATWRLTPAGSVIGKNNGTCTGSDGRVLNVMDSYQEEIVHTSKSQTDS